MALEILGAIIGIISGLASSMIMLYYFEKRRKQKALIDNLIHEGRFYYDLSKVLSKEENLKKAILAYEKALKMYTIETYPVEYAMTQNNLGNAFGILSEIRDKEENLIRSIQAHGEALKIYTIEAYPVEYAMTQNNLGNAFGILSEIRDKVENSKKAIQAYEEAIVIYRKLGLKADVAVSLNNASNRYSDLAALEDTKAWMKERLDKAIGYIEEAIGIRRELGLKADVAMSLNNASNRYSELAGLEVTKVGMKERLDKAIEYIEEAIGIRRELGLKADVAMSLNNASNRYSELAGLEVTKEARKEKLDKAVKYIEEAIVIYKELGLKADVAMSMNNASSFYSNLARLEETKEARKEMLDKAVEYIEKAIRIYRELGLKADVAMSMNNASNLYSDLAGLEETKEARKEKLDKAVEYIEEAIVIYRELGLKADVAMSMNNASSFYSDLAGLEETKEARKEMLDKAVEYIEEAIVIYRELGLKANVAGSMNNASNRYSDLAGLEESKEARKEKLDIAVECIEEAIVIYKELGLKADVATSMNNASSFYSNLAGLEETKEARKEKLDKAVEYIEEAIGLCKVLGLKANVAGSMNNASGVYYYLARLEETKEARKEKLDKAAECIEEAIVIRRELGLKADLADSLANSIFVYSKIIEFDANYFMKAEVNCDEAITIFLDFGMVDKAKLLIPYGIRFHETLYKIDSEERHTQVIEFYKSIGS
jgi:tetratricopeptide (TPR) repeat protein